MTNKINTNWDECKKGDILILKEEWMDEGDENFTFYAREDFQGGDNIYMSAKECTMAIIPKQMVKIKMLKGFIKGE